jgi:DUF1365 family protein
MESKIYQGHVVHHRIHPKVHTFNYTLFMMYLDLDEIDLVFKLSPLFSIQNFNFASFYRSDYHRPSIANLKESVLKTVEEKAGLKLNGPVRMLTHLRYFGYCMNPVTFYYCFDSDGITLKAILSEIENTPWGERFQYVAHGDHLHTDHFDKQFHVSPFFPMNIHYQWNFNRPDNDLKILMKSFQDEKLVFSANLNLKVQEITQNNLHLALIKFPLMTVKVIAGIYWQAFKLWIKKIPFYSHPNPNSQKNFLLFKGDK